VGQLTIHYPLPTVHCSPTTYHPKRFSPFSNTGQLVEEAKIAAKKID
jgi:hypothetical protein